MKPLRLQRLTISSIFGESRTSEAGEEESARQRPLCHRIFSNTAEVVYRKVVMEQAQALITALWESPKKVITYAWLTTMVLFFSSVHPPHSPSRQFILAVTFIVTCIAGSCNRFPSFSPSLIITRYDRRKS
jgi:hypothetical protein